MVLTPFPRDDLPHRLPPTTTLLRSRLPPADAPPMASAAFRELALRSMTVFDRGCVKTL